jgi:hypothetical protein
MGIDREVAETAVTATKAAGLQQAIDWLGM